MIQDMTLRWVVTLLFAFSAVVCVRAIVAHRHSASTVIRNSLHAVMAIAMGLMAWPRGAELPTRTPMLFFAAAAVWFAVVALKAADHRADNVYHTLMMAAMAWMYADMGGLPLLQATPPGDVATAGMEMPGMPGMDAGNPGAVAGQPGMEAATWIAELNWLCTIGFAVAAMFWLYRFITTQMWPSEKRIEHSVRILCQLAMAGGMAIMFAVML